MDTYETFINNVITNLPGFSTPALETIKQTLLIELNQYDLTPKTKNEIAVYTDYNYNLLEYFLSAKLVEGCSKLTAIRYRDMLVKLLDFYSDKMLKDYTTQDLRYYLAKYQKDRKVSNTTLEGMRKIICSFFNWLELENHIMRSPARKLGKIKLDTREEAPYTPEEIQTILQLADNARDKALIRFLEATAARVSEISKINKSDVDFTNLTVLLHGKGNKDREVYFTENVRELLLEYLASRSDDCEALFVNKKRNTNRMSKSSMEQLVRRLGARANITRAHPHRFRMTTITQLADKGMSIQHIQKLAGHSNVNTTLTYYVRLDQKKIQKEYMKYSSQKNETEVKTNENSK